MSVRASDRNRARRDGLTAGLRAGPLAFSRSIKCYYTAGPCVAAWHVGVSRGQAEAMRRMFEPLRKFIADVAATFRAMGQAFADGIAAGIRGCGGRLALA